MAKPLIITVRVNEYAKRDDNSNIPYTPAEIAETAAECRAAGASIIHFHARNADGSPCRVPETYAEIVARIREKTDILIDSTLGQITVKEDENRLAHVELMGRKTATRPDFAAVDAGSSNIDGAGRTSRARHRRLSVSGAGTSHQRRAGAPCDRAGSSDGPFDCDRRRGARLARHHAGPTPSRH